MVTEHLDPNCVLISPASNPEPKDGHFHGSFHNCACLVWVGLALAFALPGGVLGQNEAWFRGTGDLKKLTLEELMNQPVVLASRQAERLSGTPASVTIITHEDIRRSGATRLPEALRLAPNLQVAQVNSREWAISARGFNNTLANKLLVMIDGRSIYTPLFAGVFWDVQDVLLEDIERIEVISGPGGALWGGNAVNGVINVITKSARDTQGGLLLGGGGTELDGFGGVRYGGQLGDHVFYRVYGKYFDRESTLFSNGRNATNGWRMGQGGFRLDWDAPGQNLLTFQGDYYGGEADQAFRRDITLSGGNIIGRWSHAFSAESDLRLQMYYDRTHRRIPGTFAEDLDTYDLDFQHRFAAGERHQFVWGAGYRVMWDDVRNSPALAFLPRQKTLQVFSGFFQDRVALIEDALHLTLGTKLEHNDYTGIEVQPSGRLAWRPTGSQTLWAAVSRALRIPSRIDREFYVPGVPPFTQIQGGPGFRSEELLAYELGYRILPRPELALSITGFYHDYDNLRGTRPVSPETAFPIIVTNDLHGESYGAELAADYRLVDWWRLRAGYTHLQLDLRRRPDDLDVTRGSGESHDANHHFSLWSMWDLPWRLELDAGLRYVSRIPSQRVPGYAELDARLGWQPWPNLEFSVVGQNLLHSHHAEFGLPENRYEVERSVYGKVTWQF